MDGNRNLLEYFKKYTPNGERKAEFEKILLNGLVASSHADLEKRALIVKARFPYTVEKETLYEIEEQIKKTYALNSFRLFPVYDSGLFSEACIPDIIKETERTGNVARGFFNRYEYLLEGNILRIKIAFDENGVSFVQDARTPAVIEKIIADEFGVSVSVTIEESRESFARISEEMNRRDEEARRLMLEALAEYESRAESEYAPTEKESVEPAVALPRLSSVYGNKPAQVVMLSDTECKIGYYTFDFSAPDYIIGNEFDIRPLSIASVEKPQKDVVFVGEVFHFNAEPTRNGDKTNFTVGIFDGDSSIFIKRYLPAGEEFDAFTKSIKPGVSLAVHGYTKTDREGELYFEYRSIAVIRRLERTDNAPVKRVELHLHTNMSAMDAITPSATYVETAKKWGHPAVAITDHANVQGFPEAMLAGEKTMKVITAWGLFCQRQKH